MVALPEQLGRVPSPSADTMPATGPRVLTLGRFQLLAPPRAGGGEILLPSQQVAGLFKYLLAASYCRRSRDDCAGFLFGRRAGEDTAWARHRLSDIACKLRATLDRAAPSPGAGHYLDVSRDAIALKVTGEEEHPGELYVDALAFRRFADRALAALDHGDDPTDVAEAALALYEGGFLADDRADIFEARRQEYEDRWTSLLLRLAYDELRRDRLYRALAHLDRLLSALPCHVDAAALAMAARALTGDRFGALRTYNSLQRHLKARRAYAPAAMPRDLREVILADGPVESWLAHWARTRGFPDMP